MANARAIVWSLTTAFEDLQYVQLLQLQIFTQLPAHLHIDILLVQQPENRVFLTYEACI